jgi:hypothetical protein
MTKKIKKNNNKKKKNKIKIGGYININKTPKLIHNDSIHKNSDAESNDTVMSPLSGYENKYQPHLWNDNGEIQRTHNCYAYSLSKRTSKMSSKAQPGYFANYPPLSDKDYNCSSFYDRMKRDNPSIRPTKFGKRCGKGTYKIFLAYAPGSKNNGDTDYHYYRQDSNGMWSHKPGATLVTNKDASGKRISNPMTADRNYKHYNYSEPCGFYCVNPKIARTYSKSVKRKWFDLT